MIPADGLRTGSFRLNLDFLDLLAQGSSAGRAQRLFETFFPEGIALFEDSRSLVPRRDEALKALPPRVQTLFRNPSGQYDESRAAAALEGIRKDGFAWERLPSLLPIDASRVGTLLPALLPQFESAYRRTGTATSWEPVLEAAREIDQGFRSLLARRSQLRADLVAARAFLDAYRDASAVSVTASKGELPELYHEFLQWQAASDLLRREHEVLATLEARPKSHPPNDASTFPAGSVPVLVEPGLRDPLPDPANRRARVEAALERLAEARRQVKDWRSGAPEAAAESVPAIPLSRFDLSALDRLADAGGFGREYVHVAPKLSDAVRRAFAEAHVVECLQASRVVIRVGDPGALRELADRASAFDAAFQGLEAARSEYEAPCDGLAGMLPPLRELRDLADLDQSRQDEAVERFFERLRTPLGAALNEFTAMLTPARWAYADVVNRVETTDARPALGFVQGEAPTDTVPAPLRLNTAQLSAFALAFFLLCHRAREHPLRLGILDDPFENMDELTVTTVARGLGRYLRLRSRLGDGPDSWQLLLFLHGEQNVNRVRREV
ncbi:MAG: hypothetical protein JNL97_17090, partial [Verrucomicrobiales bacterium]|nr:hypothetical protein [Verrucomicrobiales bacterium]